MSVISLAKYAYRFNLLPHCHNSYRFPCTAAFTEQLLTIGLKIRNSSHILITICSAAFLDLAETIIFRFFADLTDLTLEYPPLMIKSLCMVSPSGSLTCGLFSMVTST